MHNALLSFLIVALAPTASGMAVQMREFVALSTSTGNKVAYGPVRKTDAEISREWAGLSDKQIQRKARIIVTIQAMLLISKRCPVRAGNAPPVEADLRLSLRPDGTLLKVAEGKGANATGSSAAEHKKCMVQSVRMASPYHNLHPKYYDKWKSLSIRLRAKG